MDRPRRFALGPALLAAALLLPGCESDPGYEDEGTPLEARAAVGAVAGTDIALGALIDGDALAIYQCGGDQTFATHTGWFRGTIGEGEDPDAFELTLDDLTLVGTRDAEGLSGELVEGDGSRHAFRVDAVADDAEAGVYLASEGEVNAGVIVRPEGGDLTAQGASCDNLRQCAQVIILAPLTIEGDAIDVQFEVEGSLVDSQVVRTLDAPEGV